MKIKTYKQFASKIKDSKTLKEAVADFGLNLCKGSTALKRDKQIVKMAINSDPFAVMYLDDDIAASPEIADAVMAKNAYLEKYIDPLSEGRLKLEEIAIEKIELRNKIAKQSDREAQLEKIANKTASLLDRER